MKILLVGLSVVAFLCMFSGSGEPVIAILRGTAVEPYLLALSAENAIVFNLSVGYLVSVFFWLLVVHLPERRRRLLLRDNFSRRYQEFREDTIQIFLWAAIGPHKSSQVKELCDHLRFRRYFGENSSELWYAVLNGLQSNPDRVKDLLLELELFASEVAYVLSTINILDRKVHLFFKRLNENIYRLKNASVYSYDQVKYLGDFLYGIHGRASVIDGLRDHDVIQDMIDEL